MQWSRAPVFMTPYGVYFKKVIAVAPEYVGLGYASFMSTMAATRFFADSFTHRFGVKKVLYSCGALISLGLLISLLYVHLVSGIIGFLLVGAGTSAVVPLVFSEAGKVKGLNPSYSIAAVSTIGFLGFLFGPPLIGWIAALSSLRASFFVVALMGLAIILLARNHFKS